jgi:hypothetical protein
MDVLVIESEPGAADPAIEALEAADHRVVRCHEPGAPAFPCRGLAPGDCPLEHGNVDVVLDVRARTTPHPDPLEDGVTCALRRRVPVVLSGSSAVNPFARFPVLDASHQDVVTACERAARGPRAEHEAVADRALEATLRNAGIDEAGRTVVHRRLGGLHVTLLVPPATPAQLGRMAAVRVAGALRAFDRSAGSIDITCETLR